jgi:hypothetical protein
MTTTTACRRCSNGWMQHPTQGWAVACPACRPDTDQNLLWLPGGAGDPEGRIFSRHQLPAGHASQAVVEMPAYVRQALSDLKAKWRARAAELTGDAP